MSVRRWVVQRPIQSVVPAARREQFTVVGGRLQGQPGLAGENGKKRCVVDDCRHLLPVLSRDQAVAISGSSEPSCLTASA
jgi:hypothetical protein